MDTEKIDLKIDSTKAVCQMGEKFGQKCKEDGKIPVIACEGSCIRGEIARLAANMIAKHEPYRRGCHGEIFTVPDSAISQWARTAERVIVIDGCFMKCHGRIMKNLIDESAMVHFDALKIYNKYTDVMDIDDVPEQERKATAEQVANAILNSLKNGGPAEIAEKTKCCSQG